MLKNRRKAFKPTIDRLDSIVLPSNVPFAFAGTNLAQTAFITSQGVYNTTNATFYVVPSSANTSYAVAIADGIVGHDNVPFMFRALDNSGNPLYDLGGNPLFDYVVFDKTIATFIVLTPNAPGYYTIPCGTPGDNLTPFVTYRGVTGDGTPLFNFAVYDNTTAFFVVHQDTGPGYFLEQVGQPNYDNVPFVVWSGNQLPSSQLQGGTPIFYYVYNRTTTAVAGLRIVTELPQPLQPFSGSAGILGHNNTPLLSPEVDATGNFATLVGPGATYPIDVLIYDHDTSSFNVPANNSQGYTSIQVGNPAHFNTPSLMFNGKSPDPGHPDLPTYLLQVYDANTGYFIDVNTATSPATTTTTADGILAHINTPFLLYYPTSHTLYTFAYALVIYDADYSTFIIVPGPNTTLYPNQPYYAIQIG